MTIEHLPVLSREVIETLSPVKGGTYVDATVGLGGHSEEILKLIGTDGRIIGIDRDEEALKRSRQRLRDSRAILKRGRFSEMEELARSEGIQEVDGVLFDLGVSMMQFREPARGFSFRSSERLDMRMDASQDLTAWDVVNSYSEKELVRVLKEYGEEFRALEEVRGGIAATKRMLVERCALDQDGDARISRDARAVPQAATSALPQ